MTRDDATRRTIALAAIVSGLLIAQQIAGRATRDSLFLTHFPLSFLPAAMMASSAASVVAALAWGRLLARRSPFRVLPWAVGSAAVLLLLEFMLALTAPRAAAALLYLHMALFGAPLVSGFWSLVNECFDPYTAKKAVGRIGTGGAIGGVAGGLLALAVSRVFPAAVVLLLMSGLVLVAALVLRCLGPESVSEPNAEPRSAFETLRGAPHLRDVALLVALGAIADTVLDYVLKAQAASTFTREASLLSFFAALGIAQALLAFAVQAAFTRVSLGELGIAGTVAVRPVLVLAPSLLGLVDPRLWIALAARVAQEVFSNSLFRAGYELLYTPVPEAEKRATKSVVDVGADKLGSLLGGALVVIVVALAPSQQLRVLFGASGALCLTALALTGRVHRGYVRSLEQSLHAGRVRLDPDEIVDDATRLTLAQSSVSLSRDTLLREIAALHDAPGGRASALGAAATSDPVLASIADLRSGDPARIRRVLRAAPLPDPALVPHLIALLARQDVFLDVLRSLRRVVSSATGQLLDALLNPRTEPVVRRRVARVLKGADSQRAVDGLWLGLDDPRLDVRRECALALAAITSRRRDLGVPRDAAFTAALRELEPSRHEPEVVEHVFTLLLLVLEREPLRLAWRALAGGDRALRGTALEYLHNVLPEPLRQALWPRLGERVR